MTTNPLRVRVFVQEDVNYANNGLGKRYSITKMCFEKWTGRTVDHQFLGTGYTFKDAHAKKREILEAYGC